MRKFESGFNTYKARNLTKTFTYIVLFRQDRNRLLEFKKARTKSKLGRKKNEKLNFPQVIMYTFSFLASQSKSLLCNRVSGDGTRYIRNLAFV